MDPVLYSMLAQRTNAAPAELANTPAEVKDTLDVMYHVGEVVDAIKKQSFYNRGIKVDGFVNHVDASIRALQALRDKIVTPTDIRSIDEGVSMSLVKQAHEFNHDAFHAAIGAYSEAGELADALRKGLESGSFDYVNFAEEFGDLLWYAAVGISGVGGSMSNVMENNIEKLRIRYPDRYTDYHANERNLDQEREVLEQVNLNQ